MNKNSRLVLKNLVIFVIILTVLIIIILFGLKKYTHHSEIITVPDVTSLTVEEASVFFEKKGLRYKVVDSLHIKSRLPGSIIEQKPDPGSRVKQNRFIFLTINASSDESISLPDVKDYSQRQAVATLEAIGLKVNDIEYVPSEFRDLVLDVQYNGRKVVTGSQLPKGSYITLVVGQGDTNGEILTPGLQGLSLNEAINAAHQKSLNLGDVHYDVTPANTEDAKLYKVYRQSPISGSPVAMGKKIELWMTTDPSLYEKSEETFLDDGTKDISE
jgi:eukaryotic-like serine/threonine-protein kinase